MLLRWTRPPFGIARAASARARSPRRRGGRAAAPAVRRPRLRPRRPPPPPAPGHGRGGLRPGQDAGAVRGHRGRAARRRRRRRCCSPGPTTPRPPPRSTANPGGVRHAGDRCVWRPARRPGPSGSCSCTAGTADLPVADECAAALTAHGLEPRAAHRRRRGRHPPPARPTPTRWPRADAVVVVAGMEGALASVVGGLTARPGRRRAHQRRLRRRPRGRHRAARRCWPRARPASPWSASTTASAPPAPSLACDRCKHVRPPMADADRRLVPLLLRHRRRHGPRRRCVDAGADLDEVRALVRRLPVAGWALEAEPVLRGGIAATKVHVHADDDHGRAHRRPHRRAWSRRPACPTGSGTRALAVFAALAEAEGRLHRRPPDQVHFHEVGGARRHRRRRRHLRGPRGARRRRGPRVAGRRRARAWSAPPTACCPTRRRPWSSCWPRCAPTTGSTCAVELTTPTGAALLAGPAPAASGRCRP